MRNMTFQPRLAAAPLLLALAAPLIGSAEIIEQVLVKVNGDIITKTELEQRQIDALRRRMNANVDPGALKTDEQVKKALAEVTPAILVDAIDDMLMVQLAKEKGFKLPDEAFNRWLTNMRKEQNLVDDQKFQAALKQEGLTMSDLRRNVERQFMIQEVQRSEVGSKLQITEEEARQYYQSHQQEFIQPATVTLREIFLEPAGQGADPEAFAEKAKAARARLAAGEDFAKVAGEESTAPSKANGGLIGPIIVAELSQALQDTLATMKPGDITQPIKAAKGYQILKLETMTPAAVQAFEKVRDLVAERVYAQRQRVEVQKFLTRIRNQAIIIWKNDELKKAYEQQIASLQQGSGS